MSESPKNSQRTARSLPPTPVDISLFEENGGFVFRTQEGMTLYRYDLDVDARSRCTDACSKKWPPVLASDGASSTVGDWKAVERGHARQWTFRGKPVYTYALDLPGTAKGDGVDGVWHVVSP